MSYPSNIIIAVKERRALSVKVWGSLSLLVAIGIIPGVFLLKNGDSALLKAFFGIIVVCLSIEMYLRERKPVQRASHPLVLVLIGLFSGLLCGIFGIGAMLTAYIGRTTKNPAAFRGNLCMVFFIESTLRLALYSFMGIITPAVLLGGLKLFPFMLLGLASGMLLSRHIGEGKSKRVIVVMLGLSGLSLFIRSLAALI